MIGSAEHRLSIGIAGICATPPPENRLDRIPRDADRVVIKHAQPCHRRSRSLLRGSKCPSTRLPRVRFYDFAFQQHPAQHVLGLTVALRSRAAVERRRTIRIWLNPFALEQKRRKIALPDRITGFRRQCQPIAGKIGVSSDTQASGKTSTDIVLSPRIAGTRQVFP